MLMVTSIGVVSLITANIAAFFIEEDEEVHLAEEVRSIDQRLDRLEELLADGRFRHPRRPLERDTLIHTRRPGSTT